MYVNIVSGADGKRDILEALQIMKNRVETTSGHADWKW
jgi:hypothetical protein